MRQVFSFKLALFLGGSITCLALPAYAQTATPAQRRALGGTEEIVVTANKRLQKLQDVGVTITAVAGAQLKARHIVSLADIAQAVPGLAFTTTENATPVYTLRGVGFYEKSLAAYPTTSVYLDEVPLPFPVMTTQTAFDLSRIEVLKGPQGTLFGNNATGGAINFIAAKPTDKLSGGYDITYANYNTVLGDGFISGPLTDNLKARLAVNFGDGDPWQYSTTREDKLGRSEYRAARLLTDWQATDTVRFQLNINGWQDKSDPQAGQLAAKTVRFVPPGNPFVVAEPFPPNNDTAADWPAAYAPRGNDSLFQFALRGDADLGYGITLTSLTSYIRYEENQTQDLSAASADLFTFGPNMGTIKSFSQELRLSNGAAKPFRWIAGLNYSGDDVYENDTFSFVQASAAGALGILGDVAESVSQMKNYAGFGNVEYDLLSNVTLKGGLRYTESDRTEHACNSDPNTGTVTTFINDAFGVSPPLTRDQCFAIDPKTFQPARAGVFEKLNEDNLSWRAGADWKFAPGKLLYVNVSKGYKAGSIPTFAVTSTQEFQPVKQESVLAYEGGIKVDLFSNMLTVDGAVYYYDYSDKQIKTKEFDPILGGLDILQNIPKSSIRGAEIEATFRPLDGLVLSDAANYNDATIDKYVGYGTDLVTISPTKIDYDGQPIPFAPRWRESVSADYTVPIRDSISSFFGLTYTYQTTENAGITKAGTSPVSSVYVLPAYGLLDLRAGVESDNGRWRLSFYGKNVTNKFYLVNTFSGNDTVLRITGRPATYGVTLGYKF